MATVVVVMSRKEQGDLSKIGIAYNKAFEKLDLRQHEFDFMSIIDVDNIVPTNYYWMISAIFENEPEIGVISGKHEGVKLKVPMGGTKCIRWKIIKHGIKEFWDPAPDMYLNIKAASLGYEWEILENSGGIIGGETSARNRTKAGSQYAGKLWAYVGGNVVGAIQRTFFRILTRKYGISFWRGFRENKTWRCNDKDVKEYYKGKTSSAYDWCKRTGVRIIGWAHRG